MTDLQGAIFDPYKLQTPDDFIFPDVQKEGVEFLIGAKKAILADKMGVGKTLQILMMNAHFKPDKVLICGSKNSTYTWMKEVRKWYPNLEIRTRWVRGTKKKRLEQWEKTNPKSITIITYGVLKADIKEITKQGWDAIYFDEAHKWRNRQKLTYKAVKKVCTAAKPKILIPITGSPASRGPQDMFTMFQIVAPEIYPSYWRYVNTYCVFDDNGFGREFIGTQKMGQFYEEIKPHYIRRGKGKDIPEKRRSIIPIEMTAEERRIYEELTDDMILELGEGNRMVASTILALRTRLRQVLACPKLIDPKFGYGSAIEWDVDHMKENDIHKSVIFTSFPAAFPFFKEYLNDRGYETLEMRGGMEAEQIGEVTEEFDRTDKKTVVLLSIKFAESFDLVAARACYCIGPDDDPEANYQAEDRVHRRGLKHELDVYYTPRLGSVEMEQFSILNEKVRNTNAIYNSHKLLKKVINDHKNSS